MMVSPGLCISASVSEVEYLGLGEVTGVGISSVSVGLLDSNVVRLGFSTGLGESEGEKTGSPDIWEAFADDAAVVGIVGPLDPKTYSLGVLVPLAAELGDMLLIVGVTTGASLALLLILGNFDIL